MGLLICAGIVLCIFFLRDVFLFGSTREHVFRKLALYTVLTSFYLLAAMRTAYSLPEGRAAELLRSPWIWVLTLLMHIGLWRAAIWFRRRPMREGMWVIALAPAPMLILSILAVTHYLADGTGSSNPSSAGVIAAAVWIAIVLLGVIGFRRAYRGWEDDAFVADLAEIASWTGIGILPFTGVVELAQELLH